MLVITGIIPAPLTKKKDENNIILKTEDEFRKIKKNVNFYYLMIIPYSNFLFSMFSKKWSEYYFLLRQRSFVMEGRTVFVIGVPGIKGDIKIKVFLNKLGYFLNRKHVGSLLQNFSIDLVHAQNVHTDAGIAYEIHKLYKIPYVTTCRGLETNFLTSYIRRCLHRSSFLICLNVRQKRIADEIKNRAVIIPHGVDSNCESVTPSVKTDSDVFRIVTVGRLLDWKNIDKVLLALREIEHDFTYHIYGEGPERERISFLIADLGLEEKVFLHGFKPHEVITEILPEYDLFILLSFPETFGRVYVEALAAGVPLIASKNTGVDGFVADGVEGFLVNHRSNSEIVSALNRIIEDESLRFKMRENAVTTSKKFAWESIVYQLNDVYERSK